MNAVACGGNVGGSPGSPVPAPAEMLRMSLVGVFDEKVAGLTAAGEARAGKLPASRLVYALMSWIDRAMVDGVGLRMVCATIVEVARSRLPGFRLSYQSLRAYRTVYGKNMHGGVLARVGAEAGRPVAGAALHPSPMAAAKAREAARREVAGESDGKLPGPVERVVNAVGYGDLQRGPRGAEIARRLFREASLTVEKARNTAVAVPTRSAARAPTAALVPKAQPTTTFQADAAPEWWRNVSFEKSTPEEMGRAHRAELAARDKKLHDLLDRLLAEKKAKSMTIVPEERSN